MSLNIYSKLEDIPSDMEYYALNDSFFNGHTSIGNTTFVSKVLEEVDSASYLSDTKFLSRTHDTLSKRFLSTSTKTLLNIVQHPNMCFNGAEMGQNALELMTQIKDGNVYLAHPCFIFDGVDECDIVYDGEHFTNVFDYLRYAQKRRGNL